MNRRSWLLRNLTRAVGSLAVAGQQAFPAFAQDGPSSIRIGWALAKTGINAGGVATTVRPNYDMWVKEVNAAGGILLKAHGKRVPIQVVEYDDRSSSEEAVRAVERLITQDKVDLVLPPWGTSYNLAVAPTMAKHGYPQITHTTVTDKVPELAKRWPSVFFMQGKTEIYGDALLAYLAAARKEGKIGDQVAMISIADGFGVELANSVRKKSAEYGFKLVYDKSYPIGSQDLSPILTEAKASKADVFIAFSYPPDTVLITEQSRVLAFNPKVFYAGVGVNFPFYRARFGDASEGILSVGGVSGDDPRIKDYFKRHQELTGKAPDHYGSLTTYASLQVLQQAIERVGKIDRAAITKEIEAGTFDTILGPVKFENQVFGKIFLVGQWQDGVFQGVGPADRPGVKTAFRPKPAWK